MPVTIQINQIEPCSNHFDLTDTPELLLKKCCPSIVKKSLSLLNSSEPQPYDFPLAMGEGNGLMETFFKAYAGEINMCLRPEHVWYAIVSQIGFYAKSHSQAMGKFLVNHRGIKTLTATSTEQQQIDDMNRTVEDQPDARLWLINHDKKMLARMKAEQDVKDLAPFILEDERIETLTESSSNGEDIAALIDANNAARERKIEERRAERLLEREKNEALLDLRLDLDRTTADELQDVILTSMIEEIQCKDMVNVFQQFEKQLESCMSPAMREWMSTSFTTDNLTTDHVVAPFLLLGTAKPYHKFEIKTKCGIPSLTLDGKLSDWELLVDKLDILSQFGDEPTLFARLLRPILKNFVKFYQFPHSEEISHYFSTCITNSYEWAETLETQNVGPWISGWLGGFCMWNEKGLCLYNANGWRTPEVTYPKFPVGAFPPLWTSIPIVISQRIEEEGPDVDVNCYVVAGCVGTQIKDLESQTNPRCYEDLLQPFSMWWVLQADDKYEENPKFEEMVNGSVWVPREPVPKSSIYPLSFLDGLDNFD